MIKTNIQFIAINNFYNLIYDKNKYFKFFSYNKK